MPDATPRPVRFGRIPCRHCAQELAHWDGGRLKFRVPGKMIAVDATGQPTMTCPECHQETPLPLRFVFVVTPRPEPEEPAAPIDLPLVDQPAIEPITPETLPNPPP